MSSIQVVSAPFSEFWSEQVRRLPSSDAAEVARLLTPRLTSYVPCAPTETQTAALLLNEVPELLYGGAAGGGKSIFLLMAALQYVDVPEYAAILLRRTLVDLQKPGALMDLAYEWLAPTAAQWSDRQKAWIFPTGATLSFGYMESERDKTQYQGAAYQFVGFDELTQFTRTQYTYLFSRRRRTMRMRELGIPMRTRAASNPGGDGHAWVYERFFTNGLELDEKGRRKRLFIPAKLSDNPHLDAEEYRESLAELTLVERKQLEEGDWTVMKPGDWFHEEWLPIVSPGDVPHVRVRRVRFWDLASTEPAPGKEPDWTRGVLMAESGGRFWIEHVASIRKGPADTEDFIARVARADAGIEQWIEREPGAQSGLFINSLARGPMKGLPVRGQLVSGKKAVRAKPLSSAASNGLVRLVEGPWNRDFIDELKVFPMKGVHDDQVDAASGAHQKLARTKQSDTGASAAPVPEDFATMKGM